MKIGDIVTREVYGRSLHFCILGFYTDPSSGDKIAILAFLDPGLVVETRAEELSPASIKDLFALTCQPMVH